MPETFHDNQGRQYTISLTLGELRRVNKTYGCDLFVNDDWQRVTGSFLERVTFLWFLLEDQAAKLGVSMDDYDRAMTGPETAREVDKAFFAELVNFYRSYGQEELATTTEVMLETMEMAKTKVRDPKFRETILAKVGAELGKTL